MNKLLSAIKEKGIDKRLHNSVNSVASLCGGNIPQEEIDLSVRHILDLEMHMNPDFEDAFAEYAYDLAMDNLVKELGIKYDPDSDAAKYHSERDQAMHSFAVMLAKMICR